MNFGLTSEQQAMRDHVRALLDDVCSMDYAARCDETHTPPREAFDALAKNGWLALIAPEEYGGAGGSATDLALLLEETGNHFEELGLWLFRSFTFGCYAILKHGTEEQKRSIVPRVIKGELTFAFALTEPDSGSDAASLRTRAVADGALAAAQMRTLQHRARNLGDALLLVSFSPDGDPASLTAVRKQKPSSHRWTLLAGAPDAVRAAFPDPKGLLLVDDELRIRGHYDAGDLDGVLRDASLALNMKSDAK